MFCQSIRIVIALDALVNSASNLRSTDIAVDEYARRGFQWRALLGMMILVNSCHADISSVPGNSKQMAFALSCLFHTILEEGRAM